jgi:DUF1680 family protein
MPVQRVTADDHVEADRGRVALMCGPLVYCLESPDNAGSLRNLSLPDDAAITTEDRADLLGGVTVLKMTGRRGDQPAQLLAIPYYANANRGPVEMQTWIPRSADALPPRK